MMILLFSFAMFSNSYAVWVSTNYTISNSLKSKLDNILDKFFNKIDKRFKNNIQEILFFKKVNRKIDILKYRKRNKKVIVAILDYIKQRINEKITQLRETEQWFCTMEYSPVCAIVKENTIRCITSPCPSNAEYKTFSNACVAQKQGFKIAYKWECKNIPVINNAINPADYQKMLKLWFDANWMTFDWEIKNYNSDLPKIWKQAWFSHVRIRFNENVDIDLLKKQVEDSLKVGLIPVIAFWVKDFKNNPDEEHLQKAVEIWKNVAEKFKDEDYKLSFDLIIEPWKNIKKHTDMLYKFYEQVIPTIRNTWWKNKYRNIFLAPNHLANPEYLDALTKVFDKFKDDKYLMAEFHFMAAGPFKNTNSTWKRMTWNGTWTTQERQKIINRLKIALDWQEKTWRKIWFGAWMPWNYNHTNDGWNNNYTIPEQVAFSKFMEETMCKMWIPNAINADQQFYDMRTWKWNQKRLPVIRTLVNSCK